MSRPIIVCDLEATCWNRNEREQTVSIMEIIEIGAVKTDLTGHILDSFSTFVQPADNPKLSDYCQQLTHIYQDDVDQAPRYPAAVAQFNEWLGDLTGHIWASWGNYDRRQFISDFNRHAVAPNVMWIPHVNLKRPWRRTTKHSRQGLRAALAFHNLDFIGTPHRGVDDARNIAKLLPYVERDLIQAEVDQWHGSEIPGRPDTRFINPTPQD